MDHVCKELKLEEKDYFGLRYTNKDKQRVRYAFVCVQYVYYMIFCGTVLPVDIKCTAGVQLLEWREVIRSLYKDLLFTMYLHFYSKFCSLPPTTGLPPPHLSKRLMRCDGFSSLQYTLYRLEPLNFLYSRHQK